MNKEIKIKRVTSQYFLVNSKAVMQNANDEWVAPYDTLTENEWKAFNNHLKQFQ